MKHGNTAHKVIQHPSTPSVVGTTNATIGRDLQASLAARRGVSAGTTVGEFKQALAQLGVTDDMDLASIEYGVARFGNGCLVVDVDPDGNGIEIREGR